MARKQAAARKARGAAGIGTIEEVHGVGAAATVETVANDTTSEEKHHSEKNGKAVKAERKAKAKPEPQAGNFAVGDIKKAAAFANSIGGLDKAIGLLQILKVAKEVQ
jgi:hypothetical protein